jgi:phosphoglycerate dehydrogenase-like enzyme
MTEPSPTPAATPSDARRFSRPSRALKVFLMEGIHENAVQVLRGAHYLGIRSRTRVTARVLEAATELRSIGCFCIGTNQVDTDGATARAAAPKSNRSAPNRCLRRRNHHSLTVPDRRFFGAVLHPTLGAQRSPSTD